MFYIYFINVGPFPGLPDAIVINRLPAVNEIDEEEEENEEENEEDESEEDEPVEDMETRWPQKIYGPEECPISGRYWRECMHLNKHRQEIKREDKSNSSCSE